MHEEGMGMPASLPIATDFYQKAASLEGALAQCKMGIILLWI